MENNLIKSEVSEELLKSFLATLSNQLTDKEENEKDMGRLRIMCVW